MDAVSQAGMEIREGILWSGTGVKLASLRNDSLVGRRDIVRLGDIVAMSEETIADKTFCSAVTSDGTTHLLEYVEPGEYALEALRSTDGRINISYDEFESIFDVLYPEGVGYWDEFTERPVLTLRGRNEPLCDEMKAAIYADGERRLKQAFIGCKWVCPKAVIFDTVLGKITEERRNPMRAYLEALPAWDGIPRIGTYFRDTLGASGKLKDPEIDAEYQRKVMEAWMVGVVARQYSEVKLEIVPVLMGDQGIGKSSALELLSPHEEWYMSTSADIQKEKDFLDAVRAHVIVEFGEGKTLKSDPDALKEFLSRSSDSYRQSYARYSGSYPRHWGAMVTTNDSTPLADNTGARRFYPLFCGTNMDMRVWDIMNENDRRELREVVPQIWAEALYRYKMGAKWWLPHDSVQEYVQDMATRVNVEACHINDTLDNNFLYCKAGSKISVNELYRVLWPGYDGIPTRDMKRTVKTWQNDKATKKVWDYRRVKINGKTAVGFYRLLDAKEEDEDEGIEIG